jgi:two-component system, OmpR family, heavy metal sensor histidine kinase CusS
MFWIRPLRKVTVLKAWGVRWSSLSLTARLALLFAGFAAGFLLVAGLVLEAAVKRHFDELDAHELHIRQTLIAQLLAHTPKTDAKSIAQRLDPALAGHTTLALLIMDEAKTPLYAFQPAHFPLPVLRTETTAPIHWHHNGQDHIGQQSRLTPHDGAPTLRIWVALDVSHHRLFLVQLRKGLWLGLFLALGLGAFLGWLAAHRGLAPLRLVTQTAQRLSAQRLGERLSVEKGPAEMQALIEAFNGMLHRLEEAFKRLSDFSADIAHELRTPVSNLITGTQVALSQARTPDAYRETLHSNLEEFERMGRMIGDMLFLAKADNGLLPRPAHPVDLAAEAWALIEFYDALAEEKGVTFEVQGHANVFGDRLMLRRALSNLLSNALRHARPQTPVMVRIKTDLAQNEAVLSVINQGDPIPADECARLFERFHRVGGVRHLQGEGAGLGLAITRAIIEAHAGRIKAESSPECTVFTLFLPMARMENQPHHSAK